MKLLPKALRRSLPPLGSTDGKPDAWAKVKLFTPDGAWTWYVVEFDGTDICYGLVDGFELEFGTFSLRELASVRGQLGLPIERDLWFTPVSVMTLYDELWRVRQRG